MFLGVSCSISLMASEEWKRLGNLVVRRRNELGMTTRESFAEATQLSSRMLGDVEKARRTNFDAGALARIEIALRWQSGSIDRILTGGDPVPISEDAQTFMRNLRHPSYSGVISAAMEDGDSDLLAVLEEVLETGQLPNEAQIRIERLRDDAVIKSFPGVYEKLTRGGKLNVAHYGHRVWFKEREQRNVVEDDAATGTSSEGDEDEEALAVGGDGDDVSDIDADRIITESTLSDATNDVEKGPQFGGAPGA